MTVKQLVRESVVNKGYSGLKNDWTGCSCRAEDIMPCDGCDGFLEVSECELASDKDILEGDQQAWRELNNV